VIDEEFQVDRHFVQQNGSLILQLLDYYEEYPINYEEYPIKESDADCRVRDFLNSIPVGMFDIEQYVIEVESKAKNE
jgi:hypothetical protein